MNCSCCGDEIEGEPRGTMIDPRPSMCEACADDWNAFEAQVVREAMEP